MARFCSNGMNNQNYNDQTQTCQQHHQQPVSIVKAAAIGVKATDVDDL
ncbi:157_t:CDS:2 [Entrophospora sp. SA101]|nr:157_t:CDS:2 [Entrophospora sp. SA101]